ncbi:hypothetical protein PR202_ga01939 [Eleusine coracana subsp. coracana]|uniref:Protein FAR1-RELATED SEQUENCE n=1 Tax=Eleusine coracana subsp. coracana TaxID=191504 RepID=A0AAV5BHQ1_ELECO|nr:hypothetical protein PR202_ga01252 [Eleusine coracana subsp. coracana]GJM86115.1 hypothetical protein PR202_ga01939 [Eleusine coracana subsp. coracana]
MCLFQIMRRTAERLGGLSEYRAINKAMQKAVYDSLTVDDFEEDWNKLITYNNALQNNDWLRSLYEVRSSWVPVFIKDTFWAGMSATQRNESFIPFFDGYVELKTTLKQFLGKYEMALQSKYEKEAQADFETFHKQRPPVSKFYMEEQQLSKVYTHNMFKKFQDEIEAIMYCHVSLIGVDGPSLRSMHSLSMLKFHQVPAVMQASQIQKGVVENGIVPAGYIGLPSNVQQFMGNQAAIRPSIVYMVPSGVDPHAFGSGVLMPVMYQQMFQVPQKPNETVPGTSANGKKKRPRSQKPTETSQLSNGTPGPASG